MLFSFPCSRVASALIFHHFVARNREQTPLLFPCFPCIKKLPSTILGNISNFFCKMQAKAHCPGKQLSVSSPAQFVNFITQNYDISICKVVLMNPTSPHVLHYPQPSVKKDIIRREFTYKLPPSVSRDTLYNRINKYIVRGFRLVDFTIPRNNVATLGI